jgi:UDP-N-acetylglucosamine 2-epimerase (hydrolysing)
MLSSKKIVFLTGTRADFGKLKPLMLAVQSHPNYELFIFATGMHLDINYGLTVNEIYKSGFKKVYEYKNYTSTAHMDRTLGTTIKGFSEFVGQTKPDLIVVHGDRGEALAGAIVGSFNNILVAHIEGGEISGTIDELIRHSVSKMSHLHFVANAEAKRRLIQMGELEDSIRIIGSPDLDLMNPNSLPCLKEVKAYYNIPYNDYAIVMFHPVTTELNLLKNQIKNIVDALIQSNRQYVVLYPNNDAGTDLIINEFNRFENNSNFKIFPSIRFEYFLKLLKSSAFIIGNSSAGIREAPFYGVPTINVGSRQNDRSKANSIVNVESDVDSILNQISEITQLTFEKCSEFGEGNSSALFIEALMDYKTWEVDCQKQFQDI